MREGPASLVPVATEELERLTERLFRVPLAEFVAERRALAAELKQRGDAALAGRVTKIAKPSLPAWLANQLFLLKREAWDAALAAGSDARNAQQQGGLSPSRLQAILLTQRTALERLVQLGEEIAREHGQSTSRGHLRKLEDTLAALVADPSRAPHGRLTETLAAPTFEALDLAAVLQAAPPAASEEGDDPAVRTSEAGSPAADPATLQRAKQRLRDARCRVEELRALEQTARRRLTEARDRIERDSRAVAQAEHRLMQARTELEARRRDVSAAEQEAAQHADALQHATEEATSAEQALKKLE